jgi:hypothetical protein
MQHSCSKTLEVAIEIGGIPVALRTTDQDFLKLLEDRYADYIKTGVSPLDIQEPAIRFLRVE